MVRRRHRGNPEFAQRPSNPRMEVEEAIVAFGLRNVRGQCLQKVKLAAGEQWVLAQEKMTRRPLL